MVSTYLNNPEMRKTHERNLSLKMQDLRAKAQTASRFEIESIRASYKFLMDEMVLVAKAERQYVGQNQAQS